MCQTSPPRLAAPPRAAPVGPPPQVCHTTRFRVPAVADRAATPTVIELERRLDAGLVELLDGAGGQTLSYDAGVALAREEVGVP